MHFPDAPENVSFSDYFKEEQKQFNERYNKLHVADLFEAYNVEGEKFKFFYKNIVNNFISIELESFLNRSTENDDAQVPQLPSTEN